MAYWVANKRSVKRDIKKLQHVKTWHLVVLLALSLFVSATFLRLNNVGMVERRDAVYAADKVGDENAIWDRLYDLQRYAATHMNADTGDVYLDNLYKADVEAITKQTEQANANGNSSGAALLRAAYETCKNRYPGYSPAYIACVQSEQAKIPAGTVTIESAQFPSPSLYRHAYIAPLWSPDYAGWAVLVSFVFAVAVIVRFCIEVYLRWQLRRTYRVV